MSYVDRINAGILGGESIIGDIRRFHLIYLTEIAQEADKEIAELKETISGLIAKSNQLTGRE